MHRKSIIAFFVPVLLSAPTMQRALFHIGRFFMLMGSMFKTMERPIVYYRLAMTEMVAFIGGSMVIVV
ncbi:MAG: hypothetical protein AAFV07_19825, partial [Bacteroidota bacterium]